VRRSAFCVLALLLFLPGCGSDDEETASPATEPTGTVTGEFVGTASDDETYVGIFVGAPTPGTGSSAVAYVGNRRVRLDGITEVAQWFTGTASGADLDLTAQGGQSRLRATLAPEGVKGTVQLPDGRSVTFETVSSTPGPAGIFEVGLDGEGNLVGTSRAGKKLKLSPFQRDAVPGYTGTVTRTDGRTVPFELFVRGGILTPEDIAGMGTPRTIVLEDGSSRGILDPIARKGKATTS